MAFMGVQWGGNRGSGLSSSVADDFVKALFGDPEREMKLAQGRSDLETDMYQRAQMESAARANAALAADREFKTRAAEQGGLAIGDLLKYSVQNPNGTAPDVSSEPAPVADVEIPLPSPAPRSMDITNAPAPITLPGTSGISSEPDYRISTYPMREYGMGAEPLAPVAPVEMPTGLYEPDFDIRTASATPPQGPQYPEDLDMAQQMPVGVDEFPPFLDPEMLRNVPPELIPPDMTQTQVPGREITIPMRDRPPPPTLEEIALPQTGGPAVVDVPGRPGGRGTPDQVYQDRPPPIAPDMPAPIGGTAATPPTATGDYTMADGSAPPVSQPQVMPGPQPNTVAVSNPRDGSVTILTDEQFNAIGQMIAANGGDIMGQAGKGAGLMQILQQGKDVVPTVAQSTLYTGSNPGVESAVAANAGITKPGDAPVVDPETGMPDMTGILTQSGGDATARGGLFLTAVNDRIARNLPVSAKEKQAYSIVANEIYQKSTTSTGAGAGGFLNTMTIEEDLAPGLRSVQSVMDYVPGSATAPTAANAATLPAETAPVPVPAETPVPAVTTVPEATTLTPDSVLQEKAAAYAQGKVSTINGQPVKNYGGGWYGDGETAPTTTETIRTPGGKATRTSTPTGQGGDTDATAAKNFGMMFDATAAMNVLDNNTPPPAFLQFLDNTIREAAANGNAGLSMDALWQYASDPATRRWAAAVLAFIDPQVRNRSGAAIQAHELKALRDIYVPAPGGNPEDIINARERRNQTMLGNRLALNGKMPPESLKRLDLELAKQGVDLDWSAEEARQRIRASQDGGGSAQPGSRKRKRKNPTTGNWEDVP